LLESTVAIESGAVEPLEEVVVELVEEVVELVVLVVVEEEVAVLEVVEVVVVEDVEVVPGSIAVTSLEKYEGRTFQGLPPPALVM
jgi:hypothetical protein